MRGVRKGVDDATRPRNPPPRHHVAQASLGSAESPNHPTVYDLLYTYYRPSGPATLAPLLWLNLVENRN